MLSQRSLRRRQHPYLFSAGLIMAVLLAALAWPRAVTNAAPLAPSAPARGLVRPGYAAAPLAGVLALPLRSYLPVIYGPTAHVYWGAFVGGTLPTAAALQPSGAIGQFETQSGKKQSLVQWGQPWQSGGVLQPFQTQYFENVRQHGSIPVLDWASWDPAGSSDQPNFQLNQIINGSFDTYLQQWAAAAKAWGHPFFLRFDWEMNGNWRFPWSAQLNGNTPADYINAWRHVHDVFTQVGATNATWVWCPNIASHAPPSPSVPYDQLYPGDSYVDWTCLDGYNFYTGVWLSFNTVFTGSGIGWLDNSYQEILAVAPTKPIMIGETASFEGDDTGTMKAAWIADAYGTQIPNNLNRIKAVIYFDWNDNNPSATLPIESSSASVAAFAAAISSNNYAGNQYSSLSAAPIPPLP